MKHDTSLVERMTCDHFIETQRQHLANLAHDVDPAQFKNIIAAAMYVISHVPGSAFYCHERDESPRIRRNGVSAWLESRENAVLFIIHRDDLEWEDDFTEQEVPADAVDTSSRGQVMICRNPVQAAAIFERMSCDTMPDPVALHGVAASKFRVERVVAPAF